MQLTFSAQVETLLKNQDEETEEPANDAPNSSKTVPIVTTTLVPDSGKNPTPEISPDTNMIDPQLPFMAEPIFDMNVNDFSWEMISLGVEEPLPEQETIDEL